MNAPGDIPERRARGAVRGHGQRAQQVIVLVGQVLRRLDNRERVLGGIADTGLRQNRFDSRESFCVHSDAPLLLKNEADN